ncbi:MAG: hypothetical protein M1826_006399 [Phylliscum demangeonii]|nr:MAG: hypothetical protein M1826_006399 [Phylliscum demangeonii]
MQTRSSSAALPRAAPPHPPPHDDDIDGPAFKRRRLEPKPLRLPTPDLSFEQRNSQANDGRYRTSKAPHQPTRSRLAKEKPPVRKAALTKANLQRIRREARQAQLPEALSEWRDIIESPPTPPSEYLVEMANNPSAPKPLRSKKSKGTLKSTTEGGLIGNPFGYAEDMAENYGVLSYNYRPAPGPPIRLQPNSFIGNHFPANLSEIQEALKRDRTDLPSADAFREFCIEASEKMLAPDEGEMDALFALFLNFKRWNGAYYGHGRRALFVPPGKLPPPQSLVKPDVCHGIVSRLLGKRTWISKHLQGYVRNRSLICLNGLVEYKTSEGSIAQARIQNQAAALILCNAWLEDEQTLTAIAAVSAGTKSKDGYPGGLGINRVSDEVSPGDHLGASASIRRAADDSGAADTIAAPGDAPNQPSSIEEAVIGTAFVGSICFDGNSIEASVHWLDQSITSVKRPYDLFSLRVATGHPFAVNLAEYQATYQKFANFLDWLSHQRDGRLRRIMLQPEAEPAAIALPDLGEHENSMDGSDDDGDGEGDADTAMTSALQPVQPMMRPNPSVRSSLGSRPADALHGQPPSASGEGAAPAVANVDPLKGGRKKKKMKITSTVANAAAHLAAKKWKPR